MEFRITTHTGRGAPVNAIESLWRHLQEGTSRTRYSQRGRNEIRASSGYDEARQAIREERLERERRAVLEAVREVCNLAPELESDWYAVGPVD